MNGNRPQTDESNDHILEDPALKSIEWHGILIKEYGNPHTVVVVGGDLGCYQDGYKLYCLSCIQRCNRLLYPGPC